MTTVSIRARPATMDDLKEGNVILLPIWNEHGPVHQPVTIWCRYPKNWIFYLAGEFLNYQPLPDFFPENCYVPAP